MKGARAAKDPRVATLELLFEHAKKAGYDGIEAGCDDLREMGFFGWDQDASVIVAAVRRAAARAKFPSHRATPNLGALYKVTDGNEAPFPGCLDFADRMMIGKLRQKLRDDSALGAEYITFQIYLPPRYMNTGGEFREDEAFLQLTAQRIQSLRDTCHAEGFNFYVETHVDRVTEDPEALVSIMRRVPGGFELNGDLSHYQYRGISKGKALPYILSHVGHMHGRMARTHGDLSARVEDPAADWEAKGLTWEAMEYVKPALQGGLSSRVLVGETGAMHLVGPEEALTQDAALVPLWRAMVAYADQSIGVAPPPAGDAATAGRQPRRGGADFDESDAERILREHFAAGGGAASSSARAADTSDEARAEQILRQHWTGVRAR